MDKFIDTAIFAARKAGDCLQDKFRNDTSSIFERGLSKELTSESDYSSEKIIIDIIENKFADHNILTEESGSIPKGSSYTWIIDPLDGSSNYMNHNPFFSVSIALAYKNDLILGVIYSPYLDEMVVAEKGKGCKINGKPATVSDKNIIENTYMVGCEGGDTNNKRFSKLGYILHQNIKDFRKIGSAAIEGYLVATGRVDAFATLNISSWDVAATILCVQEAGGMVTDFQGNPWNFEKTDLLLSNGKIHDKILTELMQLETSSPIHRETNEISNIR